MKIRSTQSKEAIREAFGGPFFPLNKTDIISGATTREWFAGMVAQGLSSSIPDKVAESFLNVEDSNLDEEDVRWKTQDLAKRIAQMSYAVADQLIEQRKN